MMMVMIVVVVMMMVVMVMMGVMIKTTKRDWKHHRKVEIAIGPKCSLRIVWLPWHGPLLCVVKLVVPTLGGQNGN